VDSKTLLQQNPPVLNWGCQLTQVVLYNGCKGGSFCWNVNPYNLMFLICIILILYVICAVNVNSLRIAVTSCCVRMCYA